VADICVLTMSLFKKSRAERHIRNTAATAISPSSEYLASPPLVLRDAVEASNLLVRQ